MDSTSANPGLTLLRIKRKRNEEHLEGLLINLPRKKQRDDAAGPGPGLFRYVETVEEEDCLPHSVNPQSLKSKVIADSNLVKSTSTQDGTSCVLSRTGGSLRYRLIKTARNNTAFEDTAVPTELRRDPSELGHDPLLVYDGVNLAAGISKAPRDGPEMARFSEMVRDYLSVHTPDLEPVTSEWDRKELASPSESDFVYDWFYHQKNASQDPICSNVGFIEVQSGEDGPFLIFSKDETDEEEYHDDPDSNDEDNPAYDYPDEEHHDTSDSVISNHDDENDYWSL